MLNKEKPVKTVIPGYPTVPATEDTDAIPAQEATDNQDEVDAWEDVNDKAKGSIFLQLSPDIQAKYKDIEIASDLIGKIVEEYGKPGVMGMS